MSIDITPLRELSSINSDNTLNSSQESSNKSKPTSKKRSFFRYFLRKTRSLSIHNEEQTSIQPVEHYDMRFFIIRHGERVDRYYGANWYLLAFDEHNQYRPYHRNLPSSLPVRPNKFFWAIDTPLTLPGLNAAIKLGETLESKNFQPTYVYSSPAMRCILTAIQILKGLGLENKIPIRIEPGLLEIGASKFGMNIFLQPNDWVKYGINIDLSYHPIMTDIPAIENEHKYYVRSKNVIREIEKRHNNSSSETVNIFIIAHATSSETLSWNLLGKPPNIANLYYLSSNIAYLHTVLIERRQENKSWSLKPLRGV